jgi:hypothetical protein
MKGGLIDITGPGMTRGQMDAFIKQRDAANQNQMNQLAQYAGTHNLADTQQHFQDFYKTYNPNAGQFYQPSSLPQAPTFNPATAGGMANPFAGAGMSSMGVAGAFNPAAAGGMANPFMGMPGTLGTLGQTYGLQQGQIMPPGGPVATPAANLVATPMQNFQTNLSQYATGPTAAPTGRRLRQQAMVPIGAAPQLGRGY